MISDSVLLLLNSQKDAYTSGQAIADELGVTRAAVWKAVESLRADGYKVESAPARGYRLLHVPDLLGEREIMLYLSKRHTGKIHALSEVDSTNAYASRLAAGGEPEGALVVSEYQTAGRGRLGRKWVSPPGVNICMSLILRPRIAPADAPAITLAASVALVRAVKGLYPALDAAIKWPNDLMLGGRKAAGILTEMSAEPDHVRHIILGVGVDVNMSRKDFPADIREVSTSVMLELGEKVSRAPLLGRFLDEFYDIYETWLAGGKGRVMDEWRKNSCTLGRKVRVTTLKGEKAGVARDIDGDGALVLDMGGGRTETVTSGDVGFI